jgi:hypothetical protein
MRPDPDPSREVVNSDPRLDDDHAHELDVTPTGPVREGVEYHGSYIPFKPGADSGLRDARTKAVKTVADAALLAGQ